MVQQHLDMPIMTAGIDVYVAVTMFLATKVLTSGLRFGKQAVRLLNIFACPVFANRQYLAWTFTAQTLVQSMHSLDQMKQGRPDYCLLRASQL